jgi:hypothetical protein
MYIGLLAIVEILVLGIFFTMMRQHSVSLPRPRSIFLFARVVPASPKQHPSPSRARQESRNEVMGSGISAQAGTTVLQDTER